MSLRKLTYNFWYFWVGEELKLLLAQSGLQNLLSLKRYVLGPELISKDEQHFPISRLSVVNTLQAGIVCLLCKPCLIED